MLGKFIILFPFLSFVVVGFFRNKYSKISGILASILVSLSAVLSCIVFYSVIFKGVIENHVIFSWIVSNEIKINWSVYVDAVTAVMLVVVNVVSALVHIYSIGYMHDDNNVPKFMSLISLFTFFMLMLVTANNILQLFFGWEGVGLASYFLIGYWYEKVSAYKAAIKAFLVNRVADICFAIGIFALYVTFGSLDFTDIFSNVTNHSNDAINLLGINFRLMDFICMMLFLGCMGKSAQIFFHTWLPDAMEGPTPVSALIHAATMVTAGVFLVVRCSPLFEYSEFALNFITIIGAVTCLFAATIALVQNDIKRIIAYSTCSQLGYMFFACGVSAYSAAMFHLMTHAFFKALLFLGAGNVIHSMSGEQDIKKMGGLYDKLPFTYGMMLIGSLALSGIMPFAGYFSKDAIIEFAYVKGTSISLYAYYLGVVAAVCTAFYSFRMLILTFHGTANYDTKSLKNIHESPMVMIVPVSILAFGAVFAGLIGEYLFKMVDMGKGFWGNGIYVLSQNLISLDMLHNLPWLIKLSPTFAGIIGIFIAYIFYVHKVGLSQIIKDKFQFLYSVLLNKYYFDEIYELAFVVPVRRFANYLLEFVEVFTIDKFLVNGAASKTNKYATQISRFHSGVVYHYALIMIIGIIFIIGWYIFVYY